MVVLPEMKVLRACQVLFGEGVRLDREFLHYLQPSGAKAAYRRRAKEVHPDLLERGSPEAKRRRSDLFRELVEAHDLVSEFFRQRDLGQWQRSDARFRPPPHRSSRPAPPAGKSEKGSRFYQGPIPGVVLSIGRYCYFCGIIPYATLIEALAWQRRQRPAIGEIATRWGWLNEEKARRISHSRDIVGRFGEKAVQLGFLGPEQVQALLFYQRSRQQRIGAYFIEQGFVSAEEMERLVRELHAHNVRARR
ncbi:MAG: hypothetical protein A2091_08325 [Desulfuromonadales bacterium GWD2_61_12]|nr:MAG: hypothetical protein A2005_08575 [Desulfuromonadales bacterium GWC2_61_20]OGR33702.1 MAG: hypothetical protein A2091_08325 [Desulfuromonadales bacterium GWD2_61_12]HAD04083.1 J domain-containing protein [Desulfuromonas sp.]HBT83730.1 J domain-containing protein [Desulfuromonas sp.]